MSGEGSGDTTLPRKCPDGLAMKLFDDQKGLKSFQKHIVCGSEKNSGDIGGNVAGDNIPRNYPTSTPSNINVTSLSSLRTFSFSDGLVLSIDASLAAGSDIGFFAEGGSGEVLDDVHEVTDGDVEHFGRHCVDDHRLPLLRKQRFADLVRVFADSERRRRRVPWSWSSFFPGGDDVPPAAEGNSDRFMVELVDRKRKWVLLK